MPLNTEELAAFQACTGRTLDPNTSFRTIVVIAGARTGKNSRLVGPIALYEAQYGGHKVSKGEVPRIVLFAQDSNAVKVTFDYISDYLTESPELKRLVAGTPLRSRIKLKNGFEIRTYPATGTAARACSFPVAVLNESAFFRLEGSANADTEIKTSVRRG